MNRWVWTSVLAAALTACAGPAGAFSFLDRSYGTPELGISARVRAMGGAGSAIDQGVYSLVDNPAALLLAPGGQVQFTGDLARASENRFVPIFDTFDSFVDENAIAVNDDSYATIEGGVILDRFENMNLTLAAGIFNRYDPRYDYFDEIRTTATTDLIVANRYIETQGLLRTATVGAALATSAGSGFGVAVNYYFGTIDDRDALVSLSSTVTGNSTHLERKLDGVSVTIGATARLNDRIQVGASVETAPQLKDDYSLWIDGEPAVIDTSTNGDLDLPLRVQGGFTFRPRNTLATTFAADVVYTPWSEVVDHLSPSQKLEDTWDVRFGLEHVFYNGVAGRIGFRYAEAYAMDEADRATFTFGFGYVLDNIHVDLAGEVGKRNSRQTPVRPRAIQGTAPGTSKDRVEDTLARVTIGASYGF